MTPQGVSPPEKHLKAANQARVTAFDCCNSFKEIFQKAEVRKEARRNKPQPWIVRKLCVLLTLGIIGYTCRAMGIIFLVVFAILGLMVIWAYEKVVLTSPGFAKDHVAPSRDPNLPPSPEVFSPKNFQIQPSSDTHSDATLPAAQTSSPQSRPEHRRGSSRHSRTSSKGTSEQHERSPRKASFNGHAISQDPPHADANPLRVREKLALAGSDAVPPANGDAKTNEDVNQHSEERAQTRPEPAPKDQFVSKVPPRIPTQFPVLDPKNRYCWREGIIKPYRAHHCRSCGRCVLKYDHHCPWIGQCVGARNHRFFVVFVLWGAIFCMWTFATLVGLVARASMTQANFNVDGQMIAIIVLSAFFMLFTVTMTVSHSLLIARNMTTLEEMSARSAQERDSYRLSTHYKWWNFREKREEREHWDAEWGRIGKEDYIWWTGASARKNWEAVMGDRVWMWLLPIGKSADDGLGYVPNPRHDNEGRPRRREDWPVELR